MNSEVQVVIVTIYKNIDKKIGSKNQSFFTFTQNFFRVIDINLTKSKTTTDKLSVFYFGTIIEKFKIKKFKL